MEEAMEPVRYRVTGMDCAADAAEIEAAARNVPVLAERDPAVAVTGADP